MPLLGGALIVAGLLVLIVGGYLQLESGVICENNPDCVPDWWLASVVVVSTLLVALGVVVRGRRHR
jgi:hypothetical protein